MIGMRGVVPFAKRRIGLNMGTVLLFRPTSGHSRSSIRQERSEPPQILLFTGVCYERHAEEAQAAEPVAEPPSPSAGGKKRRRRG